MTKSQGYIVIGILFVMLALQSSGSEGLIILWTICSVFSFIAGLVASDGR